MCPHAKPLSLQWNAAATTKGIEDWRKVLGKKRIDCSWLRSSGELIRDRLTEEEGISSPLLGIEHLRRRV